MGQGDFLVGVFFQDIFYLIGFFALKGGLHQFHNTVAVFIAQKDVNIQRLPQTVGLGLCQTSGDHQTGRRVLPTETADLLAAFFGTGAGDGTGVDDINVGPGIGGDGITRLPKKSGHSLAFIKIGFTT